MMWYRCCFVLFFPGFFGTIAVYGQESAPRDSSGIKKEKKVKVLPVPSFGYSPETSYSIGAVALFTIDFYQDSITRKSNAKAEVRYTLNKQLIAEWGWNYFTRKEKWFTNGLLHYSRYADLYYGIGAQTLPADEVQFQSDRVRLDLNLARQIQPSIFLGGGIRYFSYFNLSDEGVAPYPELINKANFGLKLRGFKDTRNNILTSTKGCYLELMTELNFSARFYNRSTFDLRKYWSFGEKENHVFAGRFYQSVVIGAAPFYDYSLLGGDQFVRGYFFGRFRDNFLSTVQLEYRTPHWWRIGAAFFGGMSAVYGSDPFTEQLFKPNLGAGLRILFDKKEGTNLRFDYAVGRNGQSGFYVSFGESF